MQTTSNFSPKVMPFVSPNATPVTGYFIFPKKLYKHFISFGMSTTDILDYDKLRQVFSQHDMAELHAYNSYLFAGKIYSKLYVSAGDCYNPLTNYSNIWKELTPNQKAEYENAIIPMAETISEEFKTLKANNVDLKNNSWSFYPLSNSQYYLIVVEDSFLSDMRIRSKCKTFVSECLQHDINLSGLDSAQRRSLYGIYIHLLFLESQHIETL